MTNHTEPANEYQAVSRALAATAFGFNEWVQAKAKRTPWWAGSVLFHLLTDLA
jgi:hypothetical protein